MGRIGDLMQLVWLLSLLLSVFDAFAGQKAQSTVFPAANENFSELEGILVSPEPGKDADAAALRMWKEVEVRCGFLGVDESGPKPFPFHAYRINPPCMIARPYLETNHRRDSAAGWDLCAFNNGGDKEKLELFAMRVLEPNIGKFVCFQGQHQGLGQFRIYRYVKLSEYQKF